MMRFWKWLGYPAILAAALAVAPESMRAADPENVKDAPTAAKDLADIKSSLKQMGADVRGLSDSFKLLAKETSQELDKLRKEVDQLRKELDGLRKTEPRVSNYGPTGKETDELRKQLDQVQQTLDAIRKQLPTTSTSLRPVGVGASRILLVNDYSFTNEFVVNGARYFVEPGMTRELSLSAGTFSYRVPTLGVADQDRVLGANEVYTIRVYPR